MTKNPAPVAAPPHPTRRHLTLGAAALAALCALPARSQGFPRQPIRLIVPFGPGSSTDLSARDAAQRIGEAQGWSFVVDNKAGGNGLIAIQELLRAPPDGHTLIMTGNTTHAANPVLIRKLPYDPIEDFSPITRTGVVPLVLFAAPRHGFRSVAELTAYARANPGKVSFGTGSASHRLAGELFRLTGNLNLTHVPYKSSPQGLTDLIGGHVDLMFVDTAVGMSFIRNGSLRPLAVTSAIRLPVLPDVPTMSESGFPGFEVVGWSAWFAPRKTPPDVVARLNQAVNGYLTSPAGRQYVQDLGGYSEPYTPEQTTQWVRSQLDLYQKTFRQAGIQPE